MKDNLIENKIINENSKIMPTTHPTSVKCEQSIIKDEKGNYIIKNYYMSLNNKQYLHFLKTMTKELAEMNEYQVNNKSIREIIISKGLEECIKEYGSANRNLTVAEVAKDLKMSENLANQLFKRKDFPSINIGKTKTVSVIAYHLWKMEHKESEVDVNE